MSHKKSPSDSVVRYISVLFGVAFLLLLMTYFMEHRQSAEAIEGLRSSVSAMETAEQLRIKSEALEQEVETLEAQVEALMNIIEVTTAEHAQELDELQQALNRSLAHGLYLEIIASNGDARNQLVTQMEQAELAQYLSDSPENDGEQSPKEHYESLTK